MMKLEHEAPDHRRYANDDGTVHIEVRPELRGQRAEMSAEAYDMPEVGDVATRMLTEQLLRQVERADCEAFGTLETRVERYDFVFYLYDDDGERLVDDDGEYVVDPEYPDPLPMVRIIAEVGVWPPAPMG